MEGWKGRIEVVVVMGVEPQKARWHAAALDGLLDEMLYRIRLRQPGWRRRRDHVRDESKPAQDHKGQAEATKRVAVFRPQPDSDSHGQQEMSRIDGAAEVVEYVGVGQPPDGSLEDQGRLVAGEHRAIERSQVVGRHAQRRG